MQVSCFATCGLVLSHDVTYVIVACNNMCKQKLVQYFRGRPAYVHDILCEEYKKCTKTAYWILDLYNISFIVINITQFSYFKSRHMLLHIVKLIFSLLPFVLTYCKIYQLACEQIFENSYTQHFW